MSQTNHPERFTISEVAADWHELINHGALCSDPIVCASKELDPQRSQQTYHCLNQPH